MEQLSGADSVFLALETPAAPQHVGGLTVLDPSGAPGFGFEAVQRTVAERIPLAPRFTMRLREVPLGLDRPYLVEEPAFDPAAHVRRIAVPSPGGIRELADLAAYLMSRPLDRGRPLWELWYVEGIARGRVAMVMKSHHCLMDGMAASGLGELLCDLSPDPASRPQPPRAAAAPRAAAGEPSGLGVALRAAAHLASAPVELARFGGRALRQAVATLATLARPDAPPLPYGLTRLRLNGVPGAARGFACASVELSRVKAVKRRFGVTVNDVLLALTGSALRRYLISRGELPEEPLFALIAVSKRAEGDTTPGNQVTVAPVCWETDVGDPIERLARIHRNASLAKDLARGFEGDFLRGLGQAIAPGVLNLGMRLLGSTLAPPLPGHVVVSNVRGTPVPLYVAGARIEAIYPLSILGPGQGLNVTLVSYLDRVDVGFTVAPELVPDAWSLAEGVPLALEELEASAAPARPESPREDARAGPSRRAQTHGGARSGPESATKSTGETADRRSLHAKLRRSPPQNEPLAPRGLLGPVGPAESEGPRPREKSLDRRPPSGHSGVGAFPRPRGEPEGGESWRSSSSSPCRPTSSGP